MRNQLNEKLSLLVDDELAIQPADQVLKQIISDPELAAKWQRYQLISKAIKQQPAVLIENEFASKIQSRLNQEPVYLLPNKQTAFMQKKAWLAVAACLAVLSVWLYKPQSERVLALPQDYQQLSQVEKAPSNELDLDLYLQAHANTAYISQIEPRQNLVRVVGFQQE